jgi:hygromycin-B 7''-O-kinase
VHDPARELREQLSEDSWRAAAAEALAAHGLPADGLAPFASGSDVVWGTAAHVVKLTAPRWTDEIEAEARWLRHVHGRLGVATPEVIGVGALGGWPYLVMTRVSGVALGSVWPSLDRAERLRLAADLGALARELHALPLPGEEDGWEAFFAECRRDVRARHARGDVPAPLLDQIDLFLAEVGPLDGDRRAVLHTELLDEHVLVEERSGRVELAALLDFADGRVGPPEYEHAAPVEFVFRGEPGLLRAYLLAYGEAPAALSPTRSGRMLAWALSHRFGSLARMLRAVAPREPATLGELSEDLYGLVEGGVR